MFSKAVRSCLSSIYSNPLILRGEATHIKQKLYTQGDVSSQGTGNQVTNQEACFADVLEKHGFMYSSLKMPAKDDGIYYTYQVNGTQQSIDFQAFELVDGDKKYFVNFDLKYTKDDLIMLNDGWFHENVVYIISWMKRISEPRRKKVVQPMTFIGLGQDINSPAEKEMYDTMCDIKKKYNSEYKGVGSLICYIRFANKYRCDKFTDDFTSDCYSRVLRFRPIARRLRPVITSESWDVESYYSSDSSESDSSPVSNSEL
jgi:hypothetical protein